MKVCMVAYAQYLCDARIKSYVRAIERSGGTVEVFALREPGKTGCDQDHCSTVFYLTRKYQGRNALFYLLSYFAFFFVAFIKVSYRSFKVNYDAVHVHNMPNILVFTAIIPALRGAKVILDVHDLMTVNYMAKFAVAEHSFPVRCLLLEQKVTARFASHVLCADHFQKRYLENVCKLRENKVSVVLNLPSDDVFRSAAAPRRSDDRFRLVYHGTIARRLGIDIMLRAIATIGDEIPVHLTVYGSGDFLPAALRLRQQLGLDKKVHFSRTYFPVELVPEMVGGMDLGIIGNRRSLATDRFMLPVKLLDYVYLKIPVVAPRLKIIRRYFDEGMIRYYEPEDVDGLAQCIVELYRSPHERVRMARDASRFYERHNWRKQAEEYLRLISAR
jgi:glycosyltransferase involved in cell wall biosynthesis